MPGWARLTVVLGILLLVPAMSGCGKKGPLYLPQPPTADSAGWVRFQ